MFVSRLEGSDGSIGCSWSNFHRRKEQEINKLQQKQNPDLKNEKSKMGQEQLSHSRLEKNKQTTKSG